MLTEEKQFVFLLTFIALGWMLGFIWIVVSGTNYYVDHMCFFSFACDRCSQVSVPEANQPNSSISSVQNELNRSDAYWISRFDDYSSRYAYSVKSNESTCTTPTDVHLHRAIWKKEYDCKRQEEWLQRACVISRHEAKDFSYLWKE